MKTVLTIIALGIFSTGAFCQVKVQKNATASVKPAGVANSTGAKPSTSHTAATGNVTPKTPPMKCEDSKPIAKKHFITTVYYACPVCTYQSDRPGKCPNDAHTLERRIKTSHSN
jgi:hypothetical protein